MVLKDKYQEHLDTIRNFENYNTESEYSSSLSNIYNYVKDISHLYYSDDQIDGKYDFLMYEIAKYESSPIASNRILDVKSKIEIVADEKSLSNILDYIVLKATKNIMKDCTNVDDFNFTNYCFDAALNIREICRENDITCYLLPLYPAFDKQANIYKGSGYHFANIIYLNNDFYLMDITYSQFFHLGKNNLDMIGLMYHPQRNVGSFMLKTPLGHQVATTLLEKGYIKLDEKIFKTYLDAFTCSYRNGLYYEKHNDDACEVEYSIQDYINFLRGKDSQVKQEGIENLGYQLKPLKESINIKKW